MHSLKEPTKPFDLDEAMRRCADAVEPFPKAAMFQLAEEGFGAAFEQLVSCLISVRTYDEVTLPASRRLFGRARTAAEMTTLSVEEIDALITPCTYHERKAVQIHAIAERVVNEFGGELPCDDAVMQSFEGIGPKCAHLALGVACIRRGLLVRVSRRVGKVRDAAAEDGEVEGRVISVDVHVHRVTNRWGLVATRTPEQTTVALESAIPRRYDVEINRILMPFGKHICTAVRPRCSTCVVRDMCPKIGVTSHR